MAPRIPITHHRSEGVPEKVIDEIRLTIDKIEHVRAADPEVPPTEGEDEA